MGGAEVGLGSPCPGQLQCDFTTFPSLASRESQARAVLKQLFHADTGRSVMGDPGPYKGIFFLRLTARSYAALWVSSCFASSKRPLVCQDCFNRGTRSICKTSTGRPLHPRPRTRRRCIRGMNHARVCPGLCSLRLYCLFAFSAAPAKPQRRRCPKLPEQLTFERCRFLKPSVVIQCGWKV